MKVVMLGGVRGGRPIVADCQTEFVAVILTQADRENIANMDPEATIYSAFPDTFPVERAEAILRELKP